MLLGLVLVVQGVLYAWLLGYAERGRDQNHAVALLLAVTPLWALAVWLVRRLRPSGRAAVLVVLGAGAALGVIATTHSPSTSDDDFRYMWDAKVQLAGIDPYRYPPSAPELAELREPRLFGPPGRYPWEFDGGSTQINRPDVRTVYPPVGEAAFTVIRVLSFGGHGGHLPLQLAALLGSLAVGALLLRRGPPWLAALWTWCPIVVIDLVNNAHIDWLGVLLVVLAFTVARGTLLRGILVGAATAVKLYPALALPALMRRDWRVALVAVATVAVTYVPHVLAVGADVIGYLPGYLRENDDQRALLLSPLFGETVGTVLGAVALAAVSLWAWLRAPREHLDRAAVLVVGVAFVAVTPTYGWYATLLLALVALTGRLEWLPVVFAPTLCYLVHSDNDHWIYLAATIATALIAAARYRVRGRRHPVAR